MEQTKKLKALSCEVNRLRQYINELLPRVKCESCESKNKTLDDRECIEDTGKCISCHQEEYNFDEEQ